LQIEVAIVVLRSEALVLMLVTGERYVSAGVVESNL